jgi:hypothetical protein
MRRVSFGNPPSNILQAKPDMRFVLEALREIEKASAEADAGQVADAFTLSNYTETRTLNAGAATLGDVANVLATFISDLQKRGTKRTA